jgi:ABC-2 type transport system ATP-binding protein
MISTAAVATQRINEELSRIAPVLSVHGVSHSYGAQQALEDVSFEVQSGRVTMLLGPNGAGKTTLFSLIVRLLALQEGEIRIDGETISGSNIRPAHKVGIVFQQPAIDLELTVEQNLAYYGRLLGLESSERKLRMKEELARMELAGREHQMTRVLNSGHRRRVEVARALMARPKLLLLDEPTVGLDPTTRRSLVSFLHQLAQETDVGVLWATHLVDEVGPEDDVVVLAKGKVVALGTLRSIMLNTGSGDLASAFEALTRPAEALE